jgi:hypothetical protein
MDTTASSRRSTRRKEEFVVRGNTGTNGRVRRPKGLLAASTLVGATLVVVLLILPPTASGTTPVVSKSPPFTGADVVSRHSPVVGWTCATQWAWLTGPHGATPSSGSVFAGSAACAHGPAPNASWTNNYPSITTSEGFLGPAFSVGSSGTHTVTYRWQVTWNASATASRGSFVAVRIELVGGLFDKTLGVGLGPGGSDNSTSVVVFFQRGSFSAGGVDQAFSLQFSAALNAGDKYQFFTVLHTAITVYASTWCASSCHVGSGSGTLNINSGGDGAQVLSMSVQ